MNAAAYAAFTDELLRRLSDDPRVLGLVALGSMAQTDYAPDRFSDHDFFVIAVPGEQEALRRDLSWLPRAADVVLSFRETAHGLKALYRDGHLVEFAVFTPEEIELARVNRYRVLFDRADVAAHMLRVAAATAAGVRNSAPVPEHTFGLFLTHLLVGCGRHWRGEALSAHELVKEFALRDLLVLLTRRSTAARRDLLDSLDPLRRFESVHPELGRELQEALRLATPGAAARLLEIAERELVPALANPPGEAILAVRRMLQRPLPEQSPEAP